MNHLSQMLLKNVEPAAGYVDTRFNDLVTQFQLLQQDRTQAGGAALAVYFQGQKVVDTFTGMQSAQQAWQHNTLSLSYSTGKGVLATLAHILVHQGFLSYDQAIADYWPEFAQQHKHNMTLRHILSHQSGLFDVRNNIAHAQEMLDWSHMLEVVAAAKPRFEIGRDNAYQALTFGWLLGGALEKATGRALTDLMQQYLVKPLQLDGAYFGVPSHELSRVARPLNLQQQSTPETVPVQKVQATSERAALGQQKPKRAWSEKLIEWTGQNPQDFKDAMIPKGMQHFSFFSDAALQANIPAANGCFTADSLARIYAMLAQRGQWHDQQRHKQQLIGQETFAQMTQIQSYARDRVMPIPMHWRLGYHRVLTLGKRAKQGFGHIGYNGSGAWCDPERGLSFAYVHNFKAGSITGDYRLWSLSQEALRCTDLILKGRKGWF